MDRESLYQSRSRPVVIELRRFCGIVQVTWLSSECSTINALPERHHALAVHDYRVQPRSDAAYSVWALGPEELDALEFYQRLKGIARFVKGWWPNAATRSIRSNFAQPLWSTPVG